MSVRSRIAMERLTLTSLMVRQNCRNGSASPKEQGNTPSSFGSFSYEWGISIQRCCMSRHGSFSFTQWQKRFHADFSQTGLSAIETEGREWQRFGVQSMPHPGRECPFWWPVLLVHQCNLHMGQRPENKLKQSLSGKLKRSRRVRDFKKLMATTGQNQRWTRISCVQQTPPQYQ